MRERLIVDDATVPRLPAHVKLRKDEARQQWLLLAPERVLVPDAIALEVLHRCDGVVTAGAIADDLAAKFAAPRDVVGRDVIAMLQDLADKGVLVA